MNEVMRGTTIIGVDGSFTRTGVAVWRAGDVALYSAVTDKDDPLPKRRKEIRNMVFRWVTPDPCLIILEATYLRLSKGNASLMLAGLHASIQDQAYRRNIPVVSPLPSQVKRFATGNGNATKSMMMDAAKLHLGLTTGNHDEADAAWLMAMGVYFYGWSVNRAGLPFARTDMLTNYPWPLWVNGTGFMRPRWVTPEDTSTEAQ